VAVLVARGLTEAPQQMGRPDSLRRHSRSVAKVGLAIIVLQCAVAALSMDVLSSVRAYAVGESHYSKGQKDALLHLQRYVQSQHEEEYEFFLRSLQAPEGDAQARRALQQFPPDLSAAREGLLAGLNAPDDIGGIVRLFLVGEHLPLMARAIQLWTDADEAIADLKQLAQSSHQRIQDPATRDEAVRALSQYLPAANARVSYLAREFSEELRRIGNVIGAALLALNLLVAALMAVIGGRFLRRSWQALQRRETETSSLLEAVTNGVLTVDASYRVIHFNPEAERLFGVQAGRAQGLALSHLVREDLRAEIDRLLADGGGRSVHEVAGLSRDGSVLDLEMTLSALSTAEGCNVAVICRDISRQRAEREHERARHAQLTQDLVRKASTDALTGLQNREALEQYMTDALTAAVAADRHLAVLFLDLDGFKAINDTYGHLAGDELLIQVAGRLRDTMRRGDAVFRVSGDEFVVVTEAHSPADTEALAARLLAGVREPYRLDGAVAQVSASIGIAVYPEAGADARSLLLAADASMYRAKQEGKNGFRVAPPNVAVGRSRPQVVRELEQALAGDELLLYYQPIVRALDLVPVGAEALVRWRHPTRGLLLPGAFVPFAEQYGLSDALGDWVLREALRQISASRGAFIGRININLAVSQLLDTSLPRQVDELLRARGLAADCLGVELTESMSMQDPETCKRVLDGIREQGVLVCMDDFGTGYSSLSQLHRMPIDKLKVDRSFVQHLPDDTGALRIVEAIVAMSHALRVGIVAEGVETVAQAQTLRQLGADDLQGFGIGRPMPWEALCELPASIELSPPLATA
jgi:diguanylate cyclase (GGDEF)-like protein/PAS domain S-box-containing protein